MQFLWQRLLEIWSYIQENFHPIWDSLDILAVTFAVYWLLLLIRGTRAVQMLTGLLVLIAVRLISDWAQLATVGLILENFFTWGVIIIIILFQQDIRRALARMGRGFFPAVSRREETQMLEEIVRAAQTLASKRVGALVVLERETRLDDLIEAGVRLEAVPTKELLTAIFLPYSPLHDGAVVVQDGRLTYAGCVLPLTLRSDLPEGVGTRHRAAVGITEDSDAVVVVVSEESAAISVVVAGEMTRDLDAPRLREVLRDLLAGEREPLEVAEPDVSEDKPSHLRSVGTD
ncbi:MAG: TIGR00159 family protein [Deltaproteobacteria bacterium]|nr:TIGR00159 family protein [Deltaproteobacteria bacterium]